MARNRLLFSTPLVAAVAVLTLVVGVIAGKATSSSGPAGSAGPGKASGLRIDVIVKATDSSFWQSMSARGLLSRRREAERVDEVLDGLRLRAGSYRQPVSTLSGGNQQKVLLARWLVADVRVLLFDEPTKGVDVGAKAELYALIGDLAARGFGIVVVSSYLPELLGLVDRIVVLRQGRMVGELPAAEATEEGLLTLASTGREHGDN